MKELNIQKQELNIKEQELNMKEQELANNKTKIIDLEYQIELLKKELNDLKDKKNAIKISAKIKKYQDLSTPTKIPQNVRKRNNKVRTFAPKDSKIDSSLKDIKKDNLLKDLEEESSLKDFVIDSLPKFNEKSNRSKNLREEYQNIKENIKENITEENIANLNTKDSFITKKKLEKINPNYIAKIVKNDEFYELEMNISDARAKYFDKTIKENREISTEKINIINKLKELYIARKEYFKNNYILTKN